jgi:hypothetical protein
MVDDSPFDFVVPVSATIFPAVSNTIAAGGARQSVGTPPEVAEDNPVAASVAILLSGG